MITLDELLTEFERLGVNHKQISQEFKTLTEWSDEWAIARSAAQKIVTKASKQGLVSVTKKPVTAIDGSIRQVPAYKIVLPKAGRKR